MSKHDCKHEHEDKALEVVETEESAAFRRLEPQKAVMGKITGLIQKFKELDLVIIEQLSIEWVEKEN